MVFFFTATFHKRVNSRLQSRASGRKGSKSDTQAPRFEIFRAGATRESLGAGRRQPPLCDWWSFLGPASWGRTSPIRGRPRGLCKKSLPRPAPGLEAFVCRSTPGNHPARQRPAGETWGGAHGGSGAGSGSLLGLSFSVRAMGREGGLRRWAEIHRDRAALGLSHVETPRAREEGSLLREWEGVLDW